MYSAGHTLTALTLASYIHKRFGFRFIPAAVLLILANLIDLDHIFNFRLDDGTANSLTLHPVHIYSGVLVFFLLLVGSLVKKWMPYLFIFAAGILLHLSADTLAFALSYNLLLLGTLDFIILGFLIYLVRHFKMDIGLIKFSFVAAFIMIGSSLIQYMSSHILHWDPQQDVQIYLVSPALHTLIAIALPFIFHEKKI